jgi:hypothetical protein
VHGYTNAAEHARDPKRHFRQEAKPAANYGSAFDGKKQNGRPDYEALSEIE